MEDTVHIGTCPECGKTFAGRTDKVFCSRKCKNRHNNALRRDAGRARSEAIGRLDRNHEILSGLAALPGKGSFSLESLVRSGFSPDAVSSHRKSSKGHDEYGCYDLVYCQTASRIFNIRKECQS